MVQTRPAWMDGAPKDPPVTPRPAVDLPNDRAMPTTHRDIVVGVVILATLALLNAWFWVGIAVTLAVRASDGGALGDGWRLAVAAVIAVVGSVLSWKVADGLLA